MIRRFLLLFFFLAILGTLSSLVAKEGLAIVTDSSMQAHFTNNGASSITVDYAYKDANGYFYGAPPCSIEQTFGCDTGYKQKTVPAFSALNGDYYQKPGSFNEPVQVWWRIPCLDPYNTANSTRFPGDPIVSYDAYVDVTCPAAPSGLTANCDASNNLSFSWNNTPHTQFDVNVNDTIDGEGGPTDTYHYKTAANSYSRSGQAGRTYTWWVHTLYNSIWSNATNGNTITCAAAAQKPPEPTRNAPTQVCSGSLVNVTFSWNGVSGATAYRLDIWDPGGVWTGNPHEDGGSTGWAYQDTGGSTSWTWWNFPSNGGQTWTARAYRDGLWSDIATWDGFLTIDCNTPVPPTNAMGAAACPFASLVVNFSWAEGTNSNETNYDIEISTSSSFATKSTRRFSLNVTNFTWSSGSSSMTSGSPLTPAYSTAYYARIRAYNSTTNLYSTYVNFSPFPIPGLPSSSCSAPKVKLTVFADRDNDGVYDGVSEDFNNGTNPEFSAAVATIVQTDNSIDSDITSGGTNPISAGGTRTGDVTAGTFAYYKITVASNWVLTNYVSDKLPLASPTCTANPCAYSALSPPATGRWISAVNQVWDLKLGMRSTTSTMNVTVFYDKDSDGVVDAGETFGGTNPNFGTVVAQIIENGGPYFEQDRTTAFNSFGALSPSEMVNSGSMRQFKVVPAVGWVLTYYRSDRTTQQLTTCGANTACTYNQGWTRTYTTTGGETFNFWLGINTLTPANPGAGPPGTGDCNGTTLSVTLAWTDNATFETGYFLEVYSNSSYTTLVGTKTFAANTRIFTWKNPGTVSEKLDNGAAPTYGARYYWRIQARNNSSTSAWVYPNSNGTGQLAPSTNPTAMPALSECTPPADPTNLVASSSCSSGIITVNFSFTDNADNENGYILDVTTGGTSSSWASTWGGKYLNGSSGVGGTVPFVWKNSVLESELLSFPDSDPNTAGNQIAPSFGTTYRWRVVAYNVRGFESNHKYPVNTTTPTGTSFATPSSASCSPPPSPANLTATPSCTALNEPQILFGWTDASTNETAFVLDVSLTNTWGGGDTWGSKNLAANSTSFTWSPSATLTGGPPTSPVNGGVYYWRLLAQNSNGNSSYSFPTPASVTAFQCTPNVTIVPDTSPPNSTVVDANTSVSFSFTVTNNGSIPRTINVGFWPEGSKAGNPLPNCPGTAGTPVTPPPTQSINLAGNASQDVVFVFTTNVAAGNYGANAFAGYDCNLPESAGTWGDNLTSQSYLVVVKSWFETLGGDVASKGTIKVSQTGTTGHSKFLLAGQTLDPSVSGVWKINNYSSPLVPESASSGTLGLVYGHLNDGFGKRIRDDGVPTCTVPLAPTASYYWCNGNVTFAGGNVNANSVWLVDGNLTITGNLTLAANSTITFIVSGNTTINSTVAQVDGIYISGGTFNTIDGSSSLGPQLVINGSVYAKSVNFARTLGGACAPTCNNATSPAIKISMDPRLLAGLNLFLGTPSVAWKEAAP